MSLMIQVLKVVPKNLLSRLVGKWAEIRWPQPLMRWGIVAFGKFVGADFAEVKAPLKSFPNLQSFFTRELIDGARPVDASPGVFVSPCDGAWGCCGQVENGQVLQVKGMPYSLADLLGDADDAKRFEGGTFATLYLSPKDYHRFHTPCAWTVSQLRYLPGELWPVNRDGVEGVPGLFAENERIVAFGHAEGSQSTGAKPDMVLIPVGATNVGKVELTFHPMTTNAKGARADVVLDEPAAFARGEEWGRFLFGSTIVIVAAEGVLDLDIGPAGDAVRLGRPIGRVSPPA